MKFYSQLNTSGSEPPTSDTPVSHSIDIPTEELKILWSLELHSFLPQYPLRLASTSTKQPTSYTHTWTDTLIMKYQRRNSATRGQSSHNVYTRALNEILFTTEHVWERTPDLWHTSQSLYRHTHRGAKNIVIIGTTQLPPTIPAPTRKHIDKATNIVYVSHTWTDTLIMKYQRRNSATRGQSSHNVYTRALNEILFTTEHVWERTPDLWHTSQSLYRHTHRGAKNIVIIGTTQLPPTIPAPTRKHIDKATNIVYTHMNRHTDNEISEKE